MGANIGTSVTSTLVSLGHIGSKDDFRRAFAGAIIHDIFNFLSVIILLPLELVSRFSEVLSGEIVSLIKLDASLKEPEMLNAITKPLTTKIIQLDKSVLDLIAKNQSTGNETLIKHICSKTKINITDEFNVTTTTEVLKKCKFNFKN
jgi:sodium-dependent phosphate cotransporter